MVLEHFGDMSSFVGRFHRGFGSLGDMSSFVGSSIFEVGIVRHEKHILPSCPKRERITTKAQESALLWLVLCFLATSIMGVEEAPPAPIAPSMGVEEVAATPLEEIMVCVIGIEEPPPASVGENVGKPISEGK